MDELRLEDLLADALRPVEPPQRMSDRLHDTFSAISEAASADLSEWADELTASELDSLRYPRNWVRPVVAVAAGGIATGALVLVGARRRSRNRSRLGKAVDQTRSRTGL